MLKLSTDNLTLLEKEMHSTLSEKIAENSELRIIEAAEICDVSSSKVSKFVRKLGFENYKQYRLYFSGQQEAMEIRRKSSEIERLINFLESYDPKIVGDFVSVFNKYNKIILFGLGPSFICAEYFAYKLATITDKNVFVSQHEDYTERLADEETLLIVFSVTGKFSSFENLFDAIKLKGSKGMLVLEENVNTRDSKADYIFYLSTFNQSNNLLPFEKTRTIFMIFIEEIIAALHLNTKETNK